MAKPTSVAQLLVIDGDMTAQWDEEEHRLLDLRAQGYSPEAIAKKLDDGSTAWAIRTKIRHLLSNTPSLEVAAYRKEYVLTADDILDRAMRLAEDKKQSTSDRLRALELAQRNIQNRADVLGFKAPTRVEVDDKRPASLESVEAKIELLGGPSAELGIIEAEVIDSKEAGSKVPRKKKAPAKKKPAKNRSKK